MQRQGKSLFLDWSNVDELPCHLRLGDGWIRNNLGGLLMEDNDCTLMTRNDPN